MPTIPRMDAPSVAPAGMPGVTQSGGPVGIFGDAYRDDIALGNAVAGFGKTLTDIATDMQHQENFDKVLRMESDLKEREVSFFDDMRRNKQGQNAWGVTDTYKRWHEDLVREMSSGLDNDAQRRAFGNLAKQRLPAGIDVVGRFESAERERSITSSAKASIESSIKSGAMSWASPMAIATNEEAIRRTAEALGQTQGWGAEEKRNFVDTAVGQLYRSMIENRATDDPLGAKSMYEQYKDKIQDGTLRTDIERKLKAGVTRAEGDRIAFSLIGQGKTVPVGADATINYVIDHFEDPSGTGAEFTDTNGTLTRFGINQAANLDLDVKTITRQQAVERYRTAYWAAIDGDNLPPDVALVAFDIAIMHNPKVAKRMLVEAGGDARKLVDLREAEQRRLLTANPAKYGYVERSWANRNAALRRALDAKDGPVASYQEAITKINEATTDPEVRAHALERFEQGRRAFLADRKFAEDQAWTDAANMVIDQSKSWTDVPAETWAALKPEDKSKLMSYKREVATNWDVYTMLRDAARDQPDVFAKTDLRKFYGQLSAAEREGLLDLKDKLKNEGTRLDALSFEQQLKAVHDQLQWTGNSSSEKRGRFDAAVGAAVAAEQKIKGKLGQEDRQVIIDRMLIDGEGWGDDAFYTVYGTTEERTWRPSFSTEQRDRARERYEKLTGKKAGDVKINKILAEYYFGTDFGDHFGKEVIDAE